MSNDVVKKEETTVNINEKKILNSHEGLKDGQSKCPKCGSTDIKHNLKNGNLQCNFCRHSFKAELSNEIDDISQLKGKIVGTGASDIVADSKDLITFKCTSCGAEVVIDTNESLQARCHWCRNTLSINQQIPNGAVPDMILPFGIEKEEAKVNIEQFVKKRNFYAHPKFKAEFESNNVIGVYLPYMVVDINANASFNGKGEILIRKYSVGTGEDRRTYYDADLYEVKRDFDITIDDLTIESNKDKLDVKNKYKTTNIINSILPFDTENCVKWDANYLKGFNSEKRDVNIEQLDGILEAQSIDIAKFKANASLTKYNRGVKWENQKIDITGQKWKATYLPVWLYSYQEIKGSKKVLHYVAVNARTKETMGSVPVYVPKLVFVSILVEIMGLIAMLFIDFDYNFIFLIAGFVYYYVIYAGYRNDSARHIHESDTRADIKNLVTYDNLIKHQKGLSNSRISGQNNTSFGNRNDKFKVISDSFVKNDDNV